MKVFQYGLLAPIASADLVERSMRVAHDYRNALIELERARRSRMRQLDTLATEQLRRAVEDRRRDVEQAVAEMRRERARTRKRSTPEAMRAAVKAAKAQLRDANAAWREARAAARQDTEAQRRRDEINDWWLEERRQLRPGLKNRPADGVCAGTYQLVEDAADKARADLPLWDGDQPNDPRFRRWSGEGFVSVQIVNGVSVRAMLDGESTQVRIVDEDPNEDRRDPESRRSAIRRRGALWLRVGSDERRRPVWARWPMIMHRPLPEGGKIKRATVLRRMVGPRAEWCVQFVVDEPQASPSCGSGAVGVDVGWRQTSRGVRVAVASDNEEVLLPEEIIGELSKVADLRGIRDRNFDSARAQLVRWLAESCEPAEWMVEATASLAQWRSQARLAALVLRWRDRRFDGDCEIYAQMEAWRRQDRHLWLWETSARTGALRRRRDFYRVVAANWARRYGTIVLEKFDLRAIARRQVDAEKAENESARSMRFVVAISEFRAAVRNAMLGRGGTVIEVPAEHTTTTCAACGERVEFDAATMLRARCSSGHEWDQDENAARNILERWSEAKTPAAARSADEPRESRRDRVRRKRAEKVARMGRSKSASETMADKGAT